MSREVSQAAWLGHSWGKDVHPLGGHPLAFRRDVEVSEVPATAVVQITASPRYLLWVNGALVCEGPARCYPHRQLYDEVDVAPYLRPGTNAFAVLAPQPSGVTGYSLVHRMGLWVDGWLTTDASWRVRQADWHTRTPWLYTLPLGPQEHLDGTLEPPGWKTEPAEGWDPVFVLGGEGTPPWTSLERSGLPRPVRRAANPSVLWLGRTEGERCDLRVVNPARAASSARFAEVPSERANAWVYDFGKTCSVSLGFRVRSCSGSVRVELLADTAWNGAPSVSLGFGHAEEGCCDTVEVPGPGFAWRGSVPRGLRFLTVRLVGEGSCELELLPELVEFAYGERRNPFDHGTFEARVWDVSKTTLRAATTDQIGEPARENVLWTFDACVAGKAAWHTFGEAALWRHCLLLIADGIDEGGRPHAVVPAGDSFMVLFDQTLLWATSCRDYGELTGDPSLAARVLPAVGRLLSLCRGQLTADDLWVPPGYAWHWVDWAKLDKRPYAFPANALLLWAAQAGEALARQAGTTLPVARDLVRRLRRSLLTFWDPTAQAFRSRRPHGDGQPWNSINTTHPMETTYPVEFDLHSQALAWWTGLGTRAQRRAAVRKILALLEQERTGELGYGPLLGNGWTQLLLAPVYREGFRDEARAVLRRLYEPWLDLGTPTWGEDFRPAMYNTAHGWGACVNTLLAEEEGGRS